MRIGRVIGNVTLSRRLPDLKPASLLLVDAFDDAALTGWKQNAKRSKPMPESLVVIDELGAGQGQIIAISEGAEATQPFRPGRVPVDAYCAAILDQLDITESIP
ncbi:MAG: carbon dioxide concentrating mechanism protein CcmL [Phycisphaeraceae bacterium]|nr:carbon dioxide concentrating mechanism protein CcmL [Phycisphaeraceae bacterium]